MRKLIKVWKNKKVILQGILNYLFPKPTVEEIYNYRIEICRDNYCGKYDKYGTSPEAVLPGHETCAACGCNLDFKLRVMEEACGLSEIGQKPLWTAEKRFTNEE